MAFLLAKLTKFCSVMKVEIVLEKTMEVGLLEKVYTGLNYMVRSQRIHINKAKQQLAMLERLYESESTKVVYSVKIISLWANEGEKSVVAKSVDLKRAITNAGKKHHKVNNRNDWQIHWEVRVEFSDGGDRAGFELHPNIYKDLLPGGEAPISLRLRT